MNEKSLEKNLANMERELIALQTAHDVGLGNVDYYQYSILFSLVDTGDYYQGYILINIKNGEKTFPFMENWRAISSIYVEPYAIDFGIMNNSSGDKFVIAYISFYPDNVNEVVVSTSQIEYRITYDVNEARNWIQ